MITNLKRTAALRDHARFLLPLPRVELNRSDCDLSSGTSDFIASQLNEKCTYLEFGAGVSTLIALETSASVVSVESDPRYAGALPESSSLTVVRPKIGRVGPWGAPIFAPWRNVEQLGYKYSEAPWKQIPGLAPKLVLVDGRFRLACSLGVILLHPHREWAIIMDDYADRAEYHALEQFVGLERIIDDRSAVFLGANVRPLALRYIYEAFRDAFEDWR